jgi:V/A-type H+-transporting ATPase subunit E
MNLGFTQLKKDLLEKAESEGQRIIEEAKNKALAAKKEIEAEEKTAQTKADEDIKNLQKIFEKREIASANLEAKKMSLIAKKELVEEAFEKIHQEINKKLNEKERKALIEKLLKRAESEIKIAKIYCNQKDSRYITSYQKADADIIGGIIAEDNESTVRVDYSFETLISEIKESELSNISRIIFN